MLIGRVKPAPAFSPSTHVEATFCFIDLAGFTALTEAQGDLDAADVATRFAELARSVLGSGDRLVKTIGDAVFVIAPDAARGIEFVERLLLAAASEERFPALRVGLHHGEAVQKNDDVFGAAVNLAARVAAEAHAGEVIGTAPIAAAARASGIPVAELGPVPLRNVGTSIPLFSLGLMVGASGTPIDPVCHTPVDRRAAAGRLRYHGSEYWFCSLNLRRGFRQQSLLARHGRRDRALRGASGGPAAGLSGAGWVRLGASAIQCAEPPRPGDQCLRMWVPIIGRSVGSGARHDFAFPHGARPPTPRRT